MASDVDRIQRAAGGFPAQFIRRCGLENLDRVTSPELVGADGRAAVDQIEITPAPGPEVMRDNTAGLEAADVDGGVLVDSDGRFPPAR